MNGEMIASRDKDEETELFRPTEDFDIAFTLQSLAERALEMYEEECGVKYDHCTGRPRAELDDLMRER
jgi:hypothetical protein